MPTAVWRQDAQGNTTSTSSPAQAFGANVVAGNALFVKISTNNTGRSVTSFSDDHDGDISKWSKLAEYTEEDKLLEIWWRPSGALNSAACTVTGSISGGAATCHMSVMEFENCAGWIKEVEGQATSGVTAHVCADPGVSSPSGDWLGLAYSGITTAFAIAASPAPAWTDAGGSSRARAWYKIGSGAGTEVASYSTDATETTFNLLVIIKPDAAGPTEKAGTDTGTPVATETRALLGSLARSDTGTPAAADASAVMAGLERADTGTPAAVDAGAVLVALTRADTGTVVAADVMSALLVTLTRADDGTVIATDAMSALLARLDRADVGALAASEVAAVVVTLSRADAATLAAVAGAAVFVLSSITGSDVASPKALDAASDVRVFLARTDAAALAGADSVGALFVSLARADAAVVVAADALGDMLARLARADAASLSAADAAALLAALARADLATLSVGDSSTLVITEVGSVYLIVFTVAAIAGPLAVSGATLTSPLAVSGAALTDTLAATAAKLE